MDIYLIQSETVVLHNEQTVLLEYILLLLLEYLNNIRKFYIAS